MSTAVMLGQSAWSANAAIVEQSDQRTASMQRRAHVASGNKQPSPCPWTQRLVFFLDGRTCVTVTSRAPTAGMDAAAAKAAASRDHGGAAWLRLAARAKIAVPAWLMASTRGTTSGARGSTLKHSDSQHSVPWTPAHEQGTNTQPGARRAIACGPRCCDAVR